MSRSARVIPATVVAAAAIVSPLVSPVATAADTPNYTYLDIADHPREPKPGFRVLPYLQKPASDQMTINFFGELGTTATVTLKLDGKTIGSTEAKGTLQEHLRYTEGERNQELEGLEQGSWLKSNNNYKYSVTFEELEPNTTYEYVVELDGQTASNPFTTSPTSDAWDSIRIVAFSDTETEPKSRVKKSGAREWERNRTFAEGSLERPGEGSAWFDKFGHNKRHGIEEPRYPLTEDEAMRYNVAEIKKQNPDLLMLPGDIAQGSGYQPGWDEFFGYVAGEHGDLAGTTPFITALGNWETFATGVNGGYRDEDGIAWGAAKGRQAYQTYFDTFGSDNPDHKNSYHRVDHGPVTIITLDSTSGLPEENYADEKAKALPGKDNEFYKNNGNSWGTDTNTQYTIEGVHKAGATDQPSFNEGSEQWKWAEKQLEDAREKGQIILVQFHHTPYSSGVHGTATASETPDDQPGSPMRVYTPLFEKYGVAAVISGHDEMFERSWVDLDGDGKGFHNFDVGVAADGLRGDYIKDGKPVDFNSHREWMAQADEPEMWIDDENGVRQLKDGGKHYGHLQMDFEPLTCSNGVVAKLTTTPVYLFPVLDSNYELQRVERRVYNDVQEIFIDASGAPTTRGVDCAPVKEGSAAGSGEKEGSSVAAGIGITVAVLAVLAGVLGFVWQNAAALPLPAPLQQAVEQASALLKF